MIDDFASVTRGTDRTLVVIEGEIDTDKVRALLDWLAATVPTEHQLTLDLTRVPFISHGAQLLRHLALRHVRLWVIAPDGSFAAHLLEIAPVPGVTVHPE